VKRGKYRVDNLNVFNRMECMLQQNDVVMVSPDAPGMRSRPTSWTYICPDVPLKIETRKRSEFLPFLGSVSGPTLWRATTLPSFLRKSLPPRPFTAATSLRHHPTMHQNNMGHQVRRIGFRYLRHQSFRCMDL
jgi:hypothetical protein